MVAAGLLSSYLSGPLPPITVNKMSVSLNKKCSSFASDLYRTLLHGYKLYYTNNNRSLNVLSVSLNKTYPSFLFN